MVPVLILIVAFSLLFFNNLGNELTLPNDEWSREIDLPLTTGNSAPFVAEEDGQYHIYGINRANKLDHLIIDEDLNVIDKSTIEVDMPPLKPFWAKGDEVVFIRDNNLILFSSGKEQILANNIDGLSANDNLLIYWQDNKIYSLDDQYNSILISEVEFPIEEVVLDKFSSDNFLVVTKPEVSLLNLTLIQRVNDASYISRKIYTIKEYSGETISYFYFATDNEKINIIYTSFSTKQGAVKYNNYYSELDINQIDLVPTFEKVKIYEVNSSIEIESPKYLELAIKDGFSTLLVSLSGYYAPKNYGVNIYEAKNIDGNWIAERRTKTNDMSVKPAWLNDETIIWLDFAGSNSYALKGASTNQNVIEKSKMIDSKDMNYALSNTILSLVVSLILIFSAVAWAVPTTVFIIIILIFNINLVERNVRWVRIIGIGLYLITQLFRNDVVFNDSFTQYAPDYLNFSYNYIVIPLILAAISGLYLLAIRSEEWDSIKEVGTFIGINLFMNILLLGPYIM